MILMLYDLSIKLDDSCRIRDYCGITFFLS